MHIILYAINIMNIRNPTVTVGGDFGGEREEMKVTCNVARFVMHMHTFILL